MKSILYSVLFSLIASFNVNAQRLVQPGDRNVAFKTIKADSILAYLNSKYEFIEDTCAQILRYSRFDYNNRKFIGHFKDVSKADTNLIIAEGTYSPLGLKEGYFIAHYLNDTLQAKGMFVHNSYVGKWEFYYSDGKPWLIFEGTNGKIKLLNAWNDKGEQTVTDGYGYFETPGPSFFTEMHWSGNIVNGLPDGNWDLGDPADHNKPNLITEYFENGKFISGKNVGGSYSDSSRLVLVMPDRLTFAKAEKLRVSHLPCGGVEVLSATDVDYLHSEKAFKKQIRSLLSNYFQKMNISQYSGLLSVSGYINENGFFANMKILKSTFSADFEKNVIAQISSVPLMKAATINDKPAKHPFTLSLIFDKGDYAIIFDTGAVIMPGNVVVY